MIVHMIASANTGVFFNVTVITCLLSSVVSCCSVSCLMMFCLLDEILSGVARRACGLK